MKITLLISTYNWPEALRLCVLSAFKQSRLPDEIVISDDGSKQATADTIAALREISPVPIIHVWQEDKGFRLAKSRNLGVLASSGDYIIQTDGDILMHRHFVADHEALAREGYMMRGRRICLNEKITKRLCSSNSDKLPRLDFFCPGIEKRRLNALYLPSVARRIAPSYRKNRPGIMGCNMAFWRKDFEAVNGYDETFEGWGSEDSDLAIRMQLNGVGKMDLKFAAICFHLWHGHPFMQNSKKNKAYTDRARSTGDIKSPKGLDSYTNADIEQALR